MENQSSVKTDSAACTNACTGNQEIGHGTDSGPGLEALAGMLRNLSAKDRRKVAAILNPSDEEKGGE
ncbi:hypothetical protein HYR69_05485 [Candidatus Sumerlaeota bacterium]|nr:hypothetical protein [Candidatus Sumerlaeota bacterium]